MTVEAFIPHQIQIIQGVGPYSTDWPALDPADIAVLIFPETAAAFVLDMADFDVSVSSAGVDVTLAAQIAEDYAEAHLWIDRKTVIEQGWAALANARERGLEAQLDRITKALQEARSGVARALRFDAEVVPMRPEAGRTIIFDDQLQPVSGPSAEEIAAAEGYAVQAGLYRNDAEAFAAISVAASQQPFLSRPTQGQLNALPLSLRRTSWLDDYGRVYAVTRLAPAIGVPGMIGWVPDGTLHPQHFGAAANMTFTGIDNILGPMRTGGTSDLAAFQAADAFAKSSGRPVIVPDGQYFLDGGFEPSSQWIAENRYAPVIWSRYGVFECGIWIKSSNSAWRGFRMIGQYDRGGIPKPGNSGHIGSIVCVGDYLTSTPQPAVSNVEVDAYIIRARNASGQVSNPSILTNDMGRIFKVKSKIGLWGAGTNVSSGSLKQFHWGGTLGTVGGVSWQPGEDPTGYPYIETYHPEECSVEFLNAEIDAAAHNLTQIWVRSATISVHIGACSSKGAARPMYDLAGDENDRIAVPEQRGRVGRGNTQGLQNHRDCTPLSVDSSGSAYQGFSRGTSKPLLAPGGDVPLMDQYPHSAKGEGLILHTVDAVPVVMRWLFSDEQGEINPGPMWLTADHPSTQRSLFWQQCSGGDLDIRYANRAVHVRQGYLNSLRLRSDIGPAKVVNPVGDFQLGYDSDNAGLIIETTRHTGTLSHNLEFGATVLRVNPISIGIQRGTRIFVNGNELVTTRYYTANSTEIEIYPSPYQAVASDPVVVVHRAGINRLEAAIQSSEFGIVSRGGYVNDADISKLSGQGRYAVWLQTHDNGFAETSIGSTMTLRGGRLPMIGRLGSQHGVTQSIHTIRVQSKCSLFLEDVTIPDNPHVEAHLLLSRESPEGPWARASLRGCRIQNPSKLAQASVLSQSITLEGCVDFDGAPVTIADL